MNNIKQDNQLLIKKSTNLKNEMDKIKPSSLAILNRLEEDFLIEHVYNSNAIEGSSLTHDETYLVIKENAVIDAKPLTDHLAAIGYKDAFMAIYDLAKDNETLSELTIKRIQSLVFTGDHLLKGRYRPFNVRVGKDMVADYTQIADMMSNLVKTYNNNANGDCLLTKAIAFHIDFEKVHPFADGNGRTGRLILNFELMKLGYLPVDIKFADRTKYYECFRQNTRDENVDLFVNLVLNYQIERLKERISVLKQVKQHTSDEK